MAKENVNHPDHYNTGKYEVIDVIEDQGWGEGFNKGNAIKYVMRAKHKNPDKEIEDLEKARWYIDREIQRLSTTKNVTINISNADTTYHDYANTIKDYVDKKISDHWPSMEAINKFLHSNDEEERIWENGKEIKQEV